MIRFAVACLVLSMSLVACNVSQQTDIDEASLIELTETGVATDVSATAAESIPTATQQPVPTSIQSIAANVESSRDTTTCLVRAGWLPYTVQSGDTLTRIAFRTASTVSEIAQANCIDNPGAISVGQVIYTPDVSRQTQSDGAVGVVAISPSAESTASRITVSPNTDVTLTWNNAPVSELTQVEFVLYPSPDSSGESLGIDTNLSNGASIIWRTPATLPPTAYIVASGRVRGQTGDFLRSVEQVVSLALTQTGANTPLQIEPFYARDGDAYTIIVGQEVTISWDSLPHENVTRVVFEAIDPLPAGTNLIGVDNDLSDGVTLQWRVGSQAIGRSTQIRATAFLSTGVITSRVMPLAYIAGVVTDLGAVVIDPQPPLVNGKYALTVGDLVSLTWNAVPAEVVQVEFVLYPDSLSLGIDQDMSDGASVQWTVTDGVDGFIVAAGSVPGQFHEGRGSTQLPVRSISP
jgi:LysM repeat protein